MAERSSDFAAWEACMGLSRVSETAKQLGITRQAVDLLRKGERQPSGALRRLMHVLAWCREQGFDPPL